MYHQKNYINLIFVKKGDDYSGFTAIPKTSFLRYLALENSFNNIFISSIAWFLGFVVICVLYFDKISWGFEKVKLRGFKC